MERLFLTPPLVERKKAKGMSQEGFLRQFFQVCFFLLYFIKDNYDYDSRQIVFIVDVLPAGVPDSVQCLPKLLLKCQWLIQIFLEKIIKFTNIILCFPFFAVVGAELWIIR